MFSFQVRNTALNIPVRIDKPSCKYWVFPNRNPKTNPFLMFYACFWVAHCSPCLFFVAPALLAHFSNWCLSLWLLFKVFGILHVLTNKAPPGDRRGFSGRIVSVDYWVVDVARVLALPLIVIWWPSQKEQAVQVARIKTILIVVCFSLNCLFKKKIKTGARYAFSRVLWVMRSRNKQFCITQCSSHL